MSYNGGSVVAMSGKNCVAIACDKRFGIQYSTVGMDFTKIFEMGPHLYLGLAGLATDVQTVYDSIIFHFLFNINLFHTIVQIFLHIII